jgi:hypothetical protein
MPARGIHHIKKRGQELSLVGSSGPVSRKARRSGPSYLRSVAAGTGKLPGPRYSTEGLGVET